MEGRLLMIFKIVSCTQLKKEEFFQKSSLGQSIAQRYADLELFLKNNIIFFENKEGLGKCYNEAINKFTNKKDYIFIFIHDDVTLNDVFYENILDKYKDRFDIMGIAGTKKFRIQSPVIWNQYREDFVGFVNQRLKNNDEYWSCSFGKSPNGAIIIDGLFMAIKGEVFERVKFDEQFTFHHYDIDFCLTAYQSKYKIGVVPICITHDSVGDWKNSKTWAENERKFLKKWL